MTSIIIQKYIVAVLAALSTVLAALPYNWARIAVVGINAGLATGIGSNAIFTHVTSRSNNASHYG